METSDQPKDNTLIPGEAASPAPISGAPASPLVPPGSSLSIAPNAMPVPQPVVKALVPTSRPYVSPGRGITQLSKEKIKFLAELDKCESVEDVKTPQYLIDKWREDTDFWFLVEERMLIKAKAQQLTADLADSVCFDMLAGKVFTRTQIAGLKMTYARLQKPPVQINVQTNNTAPTQINFSFSEHDDEQRS